MLALTAAGDLGIIHNGSKENGWEDRPDIWQVVANVQISS